MNQCEKHEMNLSALIDGEIENIDILDTIDHILNCDSCRLFYENARNMDKVLFPEFQEKEPADKIELPESLWDNIREESAIEKKNVFRLRMPPSIWAVAATVVLAVGLWFSGAFDTYLNKNSSDNPAKVVQLRLQEDRGLMTEARFIELTAELLRSDSRYHRKMLSVMEAVNKNNLVIESSDDSPVRNNQEDITEASNDIPQARNNNSRTSSPVDISFW